MRILRELSVPFKRLWCIVVGHRWVTRNFAGMILFDEPDNDIRGDWRGIAACERCGLVRGYRARGPKP